MKRNRGTFRRNFADENAGTTNAVATANLACILDPDKVDNDGIDVIAEATGSKPDFVENLVNLVEDANEARDAEMDAEVISENFSRKVREVINKQSNRKNFAADVDDDTKLADVVEIVGMVDDCALDCASSSEIAETIAEATDEPVEVIEAMVEVAKQNFAAGKSYAMKSMRKIGRQNFARLNFADDAVNPAPTAEEKPANETTSENPVVENKLPETGSEGVEQNPINEETEPKPEAPVSDAVPAGEAMAVQNELATVQSVAKVPEAESNFSRTQHKSGSNDKFATLRSLFGDKFIE